MKEHLMKIVDGDPVEVIQQLKEKGWRVLHRFGNTLVVEGDPLPSSAAEALRLTKVTAEPLIEMPADVSNESLGLLAFRLRQTEDFRRSKKERANEGEDWGEFLERL